MGKNSKKKGSKVEATHKKETKDISEGFNSYVKDRSTKLSGLNLEAEALRLNQQRKRCSNPDEHVRLIKALIVTTGTVDVDEQNRVDPLGDGDQTPLSSETQAQVFRNLWSDGFDMNIYLHKKTYPPFTLSCILGDVQSVTSLLKNASIRLEQKEMLEQRSTTFRATPLMLMMGFSKYPHIIQPFERRNPDGSKVPTDPLGVARVLLKHGARPDAQDIAGKTVVHWGAGSVCTPLTRQIVSWCIEAAKSCHHVDKQVTLKGLSDETYEGKQGILGGYDVGTTRRIVTLDLDDGTEKELLLQTKNIFYQDKCIYRSDYNLVDVPDRLKAVALHEVVMGGDPETARFLCDEHNASVDVADVTGVTPRSMSMRPFMGMESKTISIVKRHACCVAVETVQCSSCKKQGKDLSKCSRCGTVWYCDRECQVADWKMHKKSCRPKEGIVLGHPAPAPNGQQFYSFNRTGVYAKGGYQRPKDAAVNELFFVKVQAAAGGGGHGPLLLYDKSRQCEFYIGPTEAGYKELKQQVLAEKSSLGLKTHFQAKFNEKDEMIIYPATAILKDW